MRSVGISNDIYFNKKNVLDDPTVFHLGDKVVFNLIEHTNYRRAENVLLADVDYLKESRGF